MSVLGHLQIKVNRFHRPFQGFSLFSKETALAFATDWCPNLMCRCLAYQSPQALALDVVPTEVVSVA